MDSVLLHPERNVVAKIVIDFLADGQETSPPPPPPPLPRMLYAQKLKLECNGNIYA